MNDYIITKSDFDFIDETPGYDTIKSLATIVHSMGIPYIFHRCWDGWQIEFVIGFFHADVVQHGNSYGNEKGLLEAYGFPEDGGHAIGYLNIEEALRRIKNLYAPMLKSQG